MIQVGDLLTITLDKDGKTQLAITEVKEGTVNDAVEGFLGDLSQTDCFLAAYSLFEDFHRKHGDHGVEQVDRVIKQMGRMRSVHEVLTTDQGTDLLTGLPIRLAPDEVVSENYDEELMELLEKATADGSACSVIDDCLAVGVYDVRQVREPALAFCHDLFHWFNQEQECPDPQALERAELVAALHPPYSIIDVGKGLRDMPLANPLFTRWVKRNFMFDVLFGRLRVFACLDPDRFVALANQRGLKIEWSTRKEANKARSEGQPLFEVRGKYMIASLDEAYMNLGPGLFAQMVYDGILPSFQLNGIRTMLEHSKTLAKEGQEYERAGPARPNRDARRQSRRR